MKGRRKAFVFDEEFLRQLKSMKGRGFDMDFGPGGFTFNIGGHGSRHRHRHRGEGRRRRMFDSGELRLVILHLLAEEARHGYDLIRALEEMTGGSYAPSPGTVYPTLTLLEDMALIEEKDGDGKKRLFAATKAGKAYLKERAEEVERLMARLGNHGETSQRVEAMPIKPAVKRLMKAFWIKMAETQGDEETLEQIAAILNKAAKKIEKI